MKKWAVGIGIILLILAAIMLASYKTTFATPAVTQGPANMTQNLSPSAWDRTGNFTKGDVIMVEFLPNSFWAQDPGAFDEIDAGNGTILAVLYVDINITDPENTMSQYELWLTYDQTSNTFSVYNATALSFGEEINSTVLLPNGFNFTYTFYAGTAELSGTYYANVTSAGWPDDYRPNGTYVPSALELFYARTAFQVSQPYTNLLYVGYVTSAAGVMFLAYGLIRAKRKARTLTRNSRRPNSH
jgi:hypothetical protein